MFEENKSAIVFNRPQYTGEEAYVEPAVYHCMNCGAATHSKEERLNHATICGMEEEESEHEDNNMAIEASITKLKKMTLDAIKFDIEQTGDESTITMPESCRSYRKPKLVKAIWLGQTDGDIEIDTFIQLIRDFLGFIGFEHEKGYRYIVTEEYISFSSDCIDIKKAENVGKYYIFESALDLYLWLADGEE